MPVPWIITCETCQTKLRVRSAEAIGSILACPKCQSLVHVSPPEELADTPSPSTAGSEEAQPGSSSTLPVKLALAAVGLAIVAVAGLLVAQRAPREAVADAAEVIEAGMAPQGTPASDSAGPAGREQSKADETADGEPTDGGENAPQHVRETTENTASGAGAAPALPALPELPMPAQPEDDGSRRGPRAADSTQPAVPPTGLSQLDVDFGTQPSRPAAAKGHDSPADSASGGRAEEEDADRLPPAVPASSGVRMAVERIDDGGTLPMRDDPGQAMSLRVAGLEIAGSNERSPVEFVRLIADMTGTSITFTPEAYLEVRRQSSGPMIGTYRDATAGEVFTEVLKRNGLAAAQRGGHLIVVPLTQSTGRPDLVRDPEELPPHSRLAGKLRQHVTFSFTQPATVSEVLRHVERTAGVTVLVDWASLSTVGLGPRTPITASVVDQPLLDVLNGLLPQLDLAWTAVGDDAVWLSTPRNGS